MLTVDTRTKPNHRSWPPNFTLNTSVIIPVLKDNIQKHNVIEVDEIFELVIFNTNFNNEKEGIEILYNIINDSGIEIKLNIINFEFTYTNTTRTKKNDYVFITFENK